jgi:AraC-like DNA-binding protein
MRKPLRLLFLLHSDRAFCHRVERAARSRFLLRPVAEWNELPDLVQEVIPAGLVVVDPYHGQGLRGGPAPALQALLRAFPSSTVIAAPPPHPRRLRDARVLGEWGITEIIDPMEDSTESVRLLLEEARGRPLRTLLERGVHLDVPGRGRAILDAAVEVVASGGHARDLARALYLSPITLMRWCRRSGLPVPRRLLVWMRVLLAAELLDNPGQSVLSVALSCGYSSDRTLRRALHVVTGAGPTELRERGALRTVSAAFVHALRGSARSAADQRAAAHTGQTTRSVVAPYLDPDRVLTGPVVMHTHPS